MTLLVDQLGQHFNTENIIRSINSIDINDESIKELVYELILTDLSKVRFTINNHKLIEFMRRFINNLISISNNTNLYNYYYQRFVTKEEKIECHEKFISLIKYFNNISIDKLNFIYSTSQFGICLRSDIIMEGNDFFIVKSKSSSEKINIIMFDDPKLDRFSNFKRSLNSLNDERDHKFI